MAGNDQIGSFSSGELKFASWWVRNRLEIRKAGYGALIGALVLVWGYVIWGLLDAFVISYPKEAAFTRQMAINLQLLADLQRDQPKTVNVSEASVFSAPDNRLDMAVDVTNPNDQWWADFTYHFNVSGEDTPRRVGYVLPLETHAVSELGFKPTSRGGRTATLVVEDVRWHRVDPGIVGNSYKDYLANRLNIGVENVKYNADNVIGTTRVGQTSFDLVNRGAYGFWSVDLVVRLYRGSRVIGMNVIKAENIKPEETRPFQLTWVDNFPTISKTEVTPQVNVLDPSVFLPPNYFNR